MSAPQNARSVFDLPHYRRLIESRERFLRRVLPPLKQELKLQTVLDAGCGVGFFSALLAELGFQVTAFDGRAENVAEARRRYPSLRFEQADIEDPRLVDLGRFDLVFCFGLLYHLENPFRAIRNLHALANRALIVESMTIPDARPVLEFREEGPSEDQGLRHLALYPSESCLVKVFYRAGFSDVYGFADLPEHPDFHEARERRQVRSLLLAAPGQVTASFLRVIPEPVNAPDPWTTGWTPVQQRWQRFGMFLRKPMGEKWAAIRRRLGNSGV